MKELNTVNLTANQKRAIAKIIASPTPKIAGQEVSGDQNLVAARNELARLGAIHFVGGECSLTDIGERLAQEDNIADASGQLTPDGQKLAYTDTSGKEDKDVTQQPPTTQPAGMAQNSPGALAPQPTGDMGNLTMSNVPKYEPLEMLRELMEHAMVVEPSGELKTYFRTPHKQLQDLVRGLKAHGKSHEEILYHVKRHKELRVPEIEDEENVPSGHRLFTVAEVRARVRKAKAEKQAAEDTARQLRNREREAIFKGWDQRREENEEKVTKKAGPGRLFTIDEVRARARKAKVAPRKPSTPDQRMKARARHWRKTGVSDSTVEWMKKNGML